MTVGTLDGLQKCVKSIRTPILYLFNGRMKSNQNCTVTGCVLGNSDLRDYVGLSARHHCKCFGPQPFYYNFFTTVNFKTFCTQTGTFKEVSVSTRDTAI